MNNGTTENAILRENKQNKFYSPLQKVTYVIMHRRSVQENLCVHLSWISTRSFATVAAMHRRRMQPVLRCGFRREQQVAPIATTMPGGARRSVLWNEPTAFPGRVSYDATESG